MAFDEQWIENDSLLILNVRALDQMVFSESPKLRNLRCLLDVVTTTFVPRLCDLIRASKFLFSLDIDSWLSRDVVDELASALQHTPQLAQFRLLITSLSEPFLSNLSRLPLTALFLGLASETTQEARRLCETLHSLAPTLRSLELYWADSENTAFVSVFLKQFSTRAMQQLETIGISMFANLLDQSQTADLCQALELMPRLTEIRIGLSTDDAVRAFAAFFRMFRPLRRLELSANSYDEEAFLLWFRALRSNTHLQRLTLSGSFPMFPLVSSELAAAGWLNDLQFPEFTHCPLAVSNHVRDNVRSLSACKRACLVLLAARKSKRALKWVAFDVVVMIAKHLWETRNDTEKWC